MSSRPSKSRGAKPRKKRARPVAAKDVPVTPAIDLSYGGTESEDAVPVPSECVGLLPEPPRPDLSEEIPPVLVDALSDDAVQPSVPTVPASRSAIRRFLGRLFGIR